MRKQVLLIGLHPDVVEYAKWPGLTPDKLERGLAAERDQLAALGFDADWLLVKDADAGVAALADRLNAERFAVVLIGAGVRKDEDQFLLFERLVNVVHQHAPQARMAFNTNPFDTADAVQRWT